LTSRTSHLSGGDDDTVGWVFGSCVLYVYLFRAPRLSPIPPWPGPTSSKNPLVDDDVVVVFFSRIPWARGVRQQTLKGFVLFDEVSRLFIALMGVAFQIVATNLPLVVVVSFFFFVFF